MIKAGRFLLLYSVVASLIIGVSCTNKSKRQHSSGMKIVGKDTLYLLSAKTYKVDDGWGYDIYTGDKVYIHQNQVPAISGKRIFLTEEDAKKAAEMVMAKMKKRVIPSLDSMEMVNANIHYK